MYTAIYFFSWVGNGCYKCASTKGTLNRLGLIRPGPETSRWPDAGRIAGDEGNGDEGAWAKGGGRDARDEGWGAAHCSGAQAQSRCTRFTSHRPDAPPLLWDLGETERLELEQFQSMTRLKKGIYQVQTNLSMQTVQTSIWTTGLTSKGHELGNFIIKPPAFGLGNHTFANLPPTPCAPPLGCWSNSPD